MAKRKPPKPAPKRETDTKHGRLDGGPAFPPYDAGSKVNDQPN